MTEESTFSSFRFRQILASAMIIVLLAATAGTASALSFSTKLACRADYRSFCSAHKVGSHELRQCMNTNGPRLSQKCVNALVAEGEISVEEVDRRAAGMR